LFKKLCPKFVEDAARLLEEIMEKVQAAR